MQSRSLPLRVLAFIAGIAFLGLSVCASADPPSRVARLGYTTGAVSFSPGGESDWVKATVNRPLTTGDRIWADAAARAEMQVGGAMIRMGAFTSVSILNLDDRITQLQLTQGTLMVRVRRLESDQIFEVDTPNLAFTLRKPGQYRIEVDAEGDSTLIVVRKGQGEAYGESEAYVIDARQPYRFFGTGLRDYDFADLPRLDDFDRWAGDRDRRHDSSVSARYVSQDVVGYEDLDTNGTWRTDATYGNVWYPNRLAAGWAPYRDGHWAWVDPWGWTWIDDAPWGYAVSHYGRWTNQRGTWGWVPGPVRSRAYYAPALVAFVGGDTFRLEISGGSVGGIAWFPLAPQEVYRPAYAVSRGYFENVNSSNTVVNTTVINNYYNNSNVTNIVYANRKVPGAVIAVPATVFMQSQPVSRAALRVSQEVIASAPVAVVPRVAPTVKSVRGAAAQGSKPPARVFERPVVARTAPPAAHPGFAAQQQELSAKPGKPLDAVTRKNLQPAAAVPAPAVRLVVPGQASPPTALPPRLAPPVAGKAGDRKALAMPADSAAAPSPTRPATPAPAITAPGQLGNAQQRGTGESRIPSGAPTPAALQDPATAGAVPTAPRQRVAPAAPLQAAPMPPAVQPPESGAMPAQRGRSEPRPPPPQRAAPAQATPPLDAATPAPAENSARQRGQPQPPPQRTNEPESATPGVAYPAPATPPAPQRVKPEPAPAATQAEPRRPAAAPKSTPLQPEPAQASGARGREVKPAADKPDEKGNDKDEPKSDEEKPRKRG